MAERPWEFESPLSHRLAVQLREFGEACQARSGIRAEPIDAPGVGDALQLVLTDVLEREARTSDEVFHGRRDQDLPWSRLRGYPCTDIHSDARDLVSDDLALTGVETRADLQAELAERCRDRGGAPDRSDGSVEHREESIAGRVDLGPSETTELLADDRVMLLDHLTPPRVADLGELAVDPTMSVNSTVARTVSISSTSRDAVNRSSSGSKVCACR